MKLTLEPWAAEYDTSLHDAAGLETVPFEDINLHVELEEWKPVQTRQEHIDFDHLYFIDGRRRLEAKVFAQWDQNGNTHSAPGLLGTYAVGLARVSRIDAHAHVEKADPKRVLILGGDLEHPGLMIPSTGSKLGDLFYQTRTVASLDNRENALEFELQNLMRRAEAETAKGLIARASLLVVDGTLTKKPSFASSLGYVKTLHNLRLPPQEQRTLYALLKGQRSPVFQIGTGTPGQVNYEPVFSWYLRLENPVQWHQGLSGVVRLEVYAERGLEWALAVADWTCLNLPRFAAKSFRDPRAPQQLMPVAFLESELGRRMGDAGIVRRRIQAHLQAMYAQPEVEATPSGTQIRNPVLDGASRDLN